MLYNIRVWIGLKTSFDISKFTVAIFSPETAVDDEQQQFSYSPAGESGKPAAVAGKLLYDCYQN